MEREEAIKIARKLYNESLFLKKNKEAMVTLIPELAECEDERIRKALIQLVNQCGEELLHPENARQMLAWLKKQGEQKFADKVGPKFKVGDWVVYHRNDSSTEIMNVYDIRDNRYYFNDNIHFSWSVKECDEKCRIWTIEDAKAGDILVTKVREKPFIFKGLDEFHPKSPVAYCGIDFMNEFMIPAGVSWWTDEEVEPATKEQRDTLMKAMADAGYTFDFDKKVLKKIEQKPTDEEMKETLRTEYEKGRADVIAEMQKLVWSEEDTEISSMLIDLVESKEESMEATIEFVTWLKSLKDRALPKPKQEWSEEDEKMISDIVTYLNRYGNYILNKNEEKAAEIHKAADWIKSLKDKVYI